MKKKAKKFARGSMLPKLTAEDMLGKLLQEREATSERRMAKNITDIDERFVYLAEYVGRELTEDEQLAILNIVDDHTPKGLDGDYLCPLLPFDYAWEIYEIIKR